MTTLICNLTLALSMIALGQFWAAGIIVVAGGVTVLVEAATRDEEELV